MHSRRRRITWDSRSSPTTPTASGTAEWRPTYLYTLIQRRLYWELLQVSQVGDAVLELLIQIFGCSHIPNIKCQVETAKRARTEKQVEMLVFRSNLMSEPSKVSHKTQDAKTTTVLTIVTHPSKLRIQSQEHQSMPLRSEKLTPKLPRAHRPSSRGDLLFAAPLFSDGSQFFGSLFENIYATKEILMVFCSPTALSLIAAPRN
jgi:hypothetical protein